MIIKGSSRSIDRLAAHLTARSARENEAVVFLEGCDGPVDLARRLSEFAAVIHGGTRSRRPVHHASLSLSADEAFDLGDERWIESVDTLERHLGLDGHQRVVIGHQKKGRRHVHAVWCRAHPTTGRIPSDSWGFRKNEAAARELERRWSTKPVAGFHSPREPGSPAPKRARKSHDDWQAECRTGVQVDDVAAILQFAWDGSDNGRAFAAALRRDGRLCLALGRRGVVSVETRTGTPHSLARRLGLRAAEVNTKLDDLDTTTLPSVEECQRVIRGSSGNRKGSITMTGKAFGCQRSQNKDPRPKLLPEHREYWRNLGYSVEESPFGWLVKLNLATTLVDSGDVLTLRGNRPPTDEEILAMITAGKARGWKSIHFFGGDESFQQRARALAVKHGHYKWDEIWVFGKSG